MRRTIDSTSEEDARAEVARIRELARYDLDLMEGPNFKNEAQLARKVISTADAALRETNPWAFAQLAMRAALINGMSQASWYAKACKENQSARNATRLREAVRKDRPPPLQILAEYEAMAGMKAEVRRRLIGERYGIKPRLVADDVTEARKQRRPKDN